ncbi:hypothetical protein C943_00137 [Mariniradius saccharolyticus AK6]|jgi:hypothetical protein|uniref:Uncharacterized protein n=1 Tax=Mariniradius saccharolyticus AK6 TaxID=1239962 RepID=M7XKL0_9BACT|nr:hypothetical protein [Mariniradius saccharolyticus]EMS35364.1 hypothetical protein C943_00137 [Mariniradius saccharolyticus AK6]
MKKLIFAATLVLIFANFSLSNEANAQSNKEEVEFIQSIFGMEKKQAVAGFLNLPPSDPFWVLYDEYETQRKALGAERIKAIEDYAKVYSNMQDADFDKVVANMNSLRSKNDKLIDTYYKKIRKASGSKVAAQFYQIEEYILSEIRAAILGSLPFIGELD